MTYNGLASHPGGVSILLVTSCVRNYGTPWLHEILSLGADTTRYLTFFVQCEEQRPRTGPELVPFHHLRVKI